MEVQNKKKAEYYLIKDPKGVHYGGSKWWEWSKWKKKYLYDQAMDSVS